MLYLVIPTRNEAPHIAETIRRLFKSLSDLTIPWQIVVSDNGSTDGTSDVVEQLRIQDDELQRKVRLLNCPKQGKGIAIIYSTNQLKIKNHESLLERVMRDNDYFGFIDADLSADPDTIPSMVERLLEDKADIVIASRLLVTKTTNRGWFRTISSKFFNFIADLFLRLNVADAQCGLKIMNQRGVEIIQSCKEGGWFLDIEFLARARQDSLRIAEVPVPWLEFRYPNRKSQIRYFHDGIEAIKAIWRIKGRVKVITHPKPRS